MNMEIHGVSRSHEAERQFVLAIAALATNLIIFEPAQAASWVTNGPMTIVRQNHTATLLANGNVLLAGGWNGTNALAGAEVFDPFTGVCALTGAMTTNRYYHTATMLQNGKVLVAGGSDNFGHHLSSTELFDPATGTWTNTGSMNIARYSHTATMLPSAEC